MSLKEFNAKQFLLEKGEQVGLGVAVTLMVLMLIFSLFMPSKGFFSGSPKDKAEALESGSKKLENDLRTRDIPENEKPESTEGRLTDLDTHYLQPKNYEVLTMFQPAFRENPERRPPLIKNIEEGVVADARVLIDTYMFSPDFTKIWVFRDPRGSQGNPQGQGGNNPFGQLQRMRGAGGAMGGRGGMPGGRGGMMGRGGMPGNLPNISALNGPASNDRVEGLEPKLISVDQWNPQDLTARQPRPLRVAVIAGSFPYRQQLEEFRNKLHLQDINAVLAEEMKEKEGQQSFEFRGVEIQRMEVDANGKPLGEWQDVKVAEDYRFWLKWTYFPFQPEKDPKYDFVKMDGLTAPLLREFHDKKVDPTMQLAGAGMLRRFAGMPGPQQAGLQPKDAGVTELKTNYPDVVAQLPKVQATIKKMMEIQQPTRIAAPKTKPGEYDLDPFRPDAPPSTNAQPQPRTDGKTNDPNAVPDFIPDHVLVRAVDVNLEPGKRYRYRLRIKMNNPNYKRSDVASPEYKEQETLTSQKWQEIPGIVSLPPELHYYVVDERKLLSDQEKRLISAVKRVVVPAAARMWAQQGPNSDQVAMQFHRWVEQTPVRGTELVPVGDWAVADRVFVARGEYVGRKVRVDLPIWKYTRNAYILPAEDPKTNRERALALTGIDVDFGFDNSEKEDTILIDFEGGRVSGPAKGLSDDYRTEVLMLSPDGKLLARNSAKDTDDEERSKRRKHVLERIENIRAGKGAE